MERSLKKTAKSANTLKNVFLGLASFRFAGVGISSLVQASDSMQLLTDRTKLFIGEGEDALAVMNKLTNIASRQGQDIEELATVYTRLGVALKDTGISSEAMLGLTEALAKSFRLSGATGAEMAAVSVQLSQGFAAGQLRGQELRSVMEQNVALGQALTTKFKDAGLAGKSIFQFAEERGGITAQEVIEAIVAQTDNWDEAVKKLNFTIAQSVNILTNQAKKAWNNFNQQLGISAKLSKVLLLASNDLVSVLGLLAGAMTAIIVLKYGATLKLIAESAIFAGLALSGAATGATSFATAIAALKIAVGGFITKALLVAISKIALLVLGVAAAIKLIFDWDKSLKQLQPVVIKSMELVGRLAISISKLVKDLDPLGVIFGRELPKSLKAFGKETIKQAKLYKKNLNFKPIKDEAKELQDALERFRIDKTEGGLKNINFLFSKGKIKIDEYKQAIKEIEEKEILKKFNAGDINEFERREQIRRLSETGEKLSATTANVAKLNREFANNKDVAAYFQAIDVAKLEDLKEKFKKGSIDLSQIKAEELKNDMKLLTSSLNSGTMSMQEFSMATDQLKLKELDFKLKANIISLKEYNEQLVQLNDEVRAGEAISVGAERYIRRIGSVSNQIASAIDKTFSRLEDSLVEFTETGRFEFAKFTEAILKDINRIIIRAAIVQPLAGAVTGLFQPTASSGGVPTASTATGNQNFVKQAKGGAWSNGVQMFASGGVVNSPTMFGHSGGLGVMGEKGPEVIAPLKRDSQGNMGVGAVPANVIINVNNQSGAEVQQSETVNENGERVIEMLVVNTVKSGLAGGSFDKQLNVNFGVNRKR
jgi:lambda family phage tail tape measure protein